MIFIDFCLFEGNFPYFGKGFIEDFWSTSLIFIILARGSSRIFDQNHWFSSFWQGVHPGFWSKSPSFIIFGPRFSPSFLLSFFPFFPSFSLLVVIFRVRLRSVHVSRASSIIVHQHPPHAHITNPNDSKSNAQTNKLEKREQPVAAHGAPLIPQGQLTLSSFWLILSSLWLTLSSFWAHFTQNPWCTP